MPNQTMPNQTKPNNTKQYQTKPNKSKQNKTKPNQTMSNQTKSNTTILNQIKPNQTMSNQTKIIKCHTRNLILGWNNHQTKPDHSPKPKQSNCLLCEAVFVFCVDLCSAIRTKKDKYTTINLICAILVFCLFVLCFSNEERLISKQKFNIIM